MSVALAPKLQAEVPASLYEVEDLNHVVGGLATIRSMRNPATVVL